MLRLESLNTYTHTRHSGPPNRFASDTKRALQILNCAYMAIRVCMYARQHAYDIQIYT